MFLKGFDSKLATGLSRLRETEFSAKKTRLKETLLKANLKAELEQRELRGRK